MNDFKMNSYLFTFIALFGVSLTNGMDLYCWSGHDKSTISNQSCTIENNTTTAAPDNTTIQNKDGDQVVSFCYELIYHDNSTSLNFESDPVSARTAHRNASCDFLGLCNDSIVGTHVKTTVNDIEVILICCKGDNCNHNPDVLPVIKPVCNNLQSNGTVAMGHYKETCSGSDDLCMSITVYKEGTILNQKLQCGSKQQCSAANKTYIQEELCHTQEDKGEQTEVCCCSGDLCIPVPENVTIIIPKDNNDTDSALDKVIHNKVQVQSKKGTDWLFVGGLIAAGALVLIVTVAVLVVWRLKKRRQAAARNRMLFSYMPISASEVDDDDVQMLL
ncbi:uncharacterized protein LOC133181072 [Saccostrea echinata]|uniref:uncharacterized protein LOC133181072 n=1 Tax=Saccostrea echinata TaxID=191078 RepID=UPI002A82C383|nr:uncharacterized protein LOC133181072 [Saccostrea echinata]